MIPCHVHVHQCPVPPPPGFPGPHQVVVDEFGSRGGAELARADAERRWRVFHRIRWATESTKT